MASDLTERKRRRESEEGKNDQTVHAKRDKREASRYVCYFVELLDSCYTVVFLLLFLSIQHCGSPCSSTVPLSN